MAEWFREIAPFFQALLASVGTWFLTLLGASVVLFVREAPRWLLDLLLGFAAGVMVAASCWSLLIPSIERGGIWPAAIGLALGGAALYGLDKFLPHLHAPGRPVEGRKSRWHRTYLLVMAITLHNVPEGLAVGVAFGADDFGTAAALAIGIALQNVPEGLAVALPLRREGMGRGKALWYGQLSAVVEPVTAVVGVSLVSVMQVALPYGLAFAAGGMLYVVVEEMIPEAGKEGHIDEATLGFLVGFIVMMTLDNAFG